VKRLLLVATAFFAGVVAGCGGGGGNPAPPPPTGGFTNASLKGQYTFSMSGSDPTGAYIARTGTFIADGAGNISGGLEDVVALGSGSPPTIVSFTSGTYEIQANGRGLVVFQTGSGGVLQVNMAMSSVSQGYLVQTDLNATSSGSFNIATPTDFAASTVNGKYVFDVSGVSISPTAIAPLSVIGQVIADGNGNVTGGLIDTNDGNVALPSGATAVNPGTFGMDTTNGTTYGRGAITFNGRAFAFYIVDNTRVKFIEEDSIGGTTGDAVLQSGVPTTTAAINGSFTYLVGGSALVGDFGPDARVARFTADGSGNVGAISYDENNDGNYNHISQGSNISAATYTIDSSGSGRGTFTFKDSSSGTFTYVFYLSSASQGVLQDTSANLIADGTILAQSAGPFTLSGSAGTYAFNWSGVELGSNTAVPFEEDFTGQFALTSASSSNVSGVADFVELGLSGNNLFTNIAVSGALTISGDGTQNNQYKIVLAGSPSTTITFQAYFAGPNTFFLVCSDNTRTTAGISVGQTTPN